MYPKWAHLRRWLAQDAHCRTCARYRLGLLVVVLLAASTWWMS
jgi:hypothetical protein